MYLIRLLVLTVSLLLLSSCSMSKARIGITHAQQGMPADLYVDGVQKKIDADGNGEYRFSVEAGKHRLEVVQWGRTVLDTTIDVSGGYALAGFSFGGMVAASLMIVGAGPFIELVVLLAGAPLGMAFSPTNEYRVSVNDLKYPAPSEPKWMWLKNVPLAVNYKYRNGKNMVQVESFCYDSGKGRVWLRDAEKHVPFALDMGDAAMCVEDGGAFVCEPSSKETWEKFPCAEVANQ